MEIAVPTLTSDGFATDIRKMADSLIAYYFESDHSQSNEYQGQVISIAKHIQLFGMDPPSLKARMQSDLEAYLSKHFDSARVTITIANTQDSAFYDIQFDGVVVKGDASYSVGKLIQVQNNRVTRIIELANTGAQ